MQGPSTKTKEDKCLNSRNLEFGRAKKGKPNAFSSILTSDRVAVSSVSLHCTYTECKTGLPEDRSILPLPHDKEGQRSDTEGWQKPVS